MSRMCSENGMPSGGSDDRARDDRDWDGTVTNRAGAGRLSVDRSGNAAGLVDV